MKQKAKIYKGKRIVMGDKNLVTKNEIHVNDIPQEGGESGGGGGSASSVEYLDISGTGDAELIVTECSLLAKAYMEGTYYIGTTALLVLAGFIGIRNAPVAVAIDFNTKIAVGEVMTIKDFIISKGITEDQLAAIPRITEEKFYNRIG